MGTRCLIIESVSLKKRKKKAMKIMKQIAKYSKGVILIYMKKKKNAPSGLGMPVWGCQLFKFSVASEAMFPDNSIMAATPHPIMYIGTGYGNSACPLGTARYCGQCLRPRPH